MFKLNEEQNVARLLQKVNTVIAFIAFLPALFCWLTTVDCLSPRVQRSDDFSLFSTPYDETGYYVLLSILYLVYYGYTLLCPRFYLNKDYKRENTISYWTLVFITNLLTIILFIAWIGVEKFSAFDEYWILIIIPLIPFIISVKGMVADNSRKSVTNEK